MIRHTLSRKSPTSSRSLEWRVCFPSYATVLIAWLSPCGLDLCGSHCLFTLFGSRDSSVGVPTGCTTGFRFSESTNDLSLLHSVQTASGTHPVSCPLGTGRAFLTGKAAGSWSWPVTSIKNAAVTAVTTAVNRCCWVDTKFTAQEFVERSPVFK
jgi:hypothetical protein